MNDPIYRRRLDLQRQLKVPSAATLHWPAEPNQHSVRLDAARQRATAAWLS